MEVGNAVSTVSIGENMCTSGFVQSTLGPAPTLMIMFRHKSNRTTTTTTTAVTRQTTMSAELVDDSGDEVLVEDITPSVLSSFTELRDDHELNSEDGFKKFLKDCGMDKYYRFQEGVDLATQYRQVETIIRSITSVRVGTYDGQHRMMPLIHSDNGVNHEERDDEKMGDHKPEHMTNEPMP